MSVIELKNVSKFYYNEGIISSGFTKVNLSFDMGEFVVITGESGSGKSTLLNVISGLDSYEEGEMFINGNETSHYSDKDYEDYRNKYVGNIFQNFNLVNSYTVYQNIALVLQLSGKKKKDYKKDVIDLIKKVGLYKYRNTKVSKLSGGQKQKTAIARALAKNTPMIICDEPTGNLDSVSANEIINLLSEISKEKLVIIVTHNFDQVKPFASRVIRMHDGRVLEDKKVKDVNTIKDYKIYDIDKVRFIDKVKISLINTFNIIPKFLLLFIVYLFMTSSIITEYGSMKYNEYLSSIDGYNMIFSNTSDKRIVINKKDRSLISDDDFNKLNSLDNVSFILKNDIFTDVITALSDDSSLYIESYSYDISMFNKELKVGVLPSNYDEAVLVCNNSDYYCTDDNFSEILNKSFNIEIYTNLGSKFYKENGINKKVKIVGIAYDDSYSGYNALYMSEQLLNKLSTVYNDGSSTSKIVLDNNKLDYVNILPSSYVPKGKVYISENLSYYCKDFKCNNKVLNIDTSNIYYDNSIKLNISNVFDKNNINKLLSLKNYEDYSNYIFINNEDYNNLFNKGIYQSSIFVKDPKYIDSTLNSLNDLGYNALAIKDTIVSSEYEGILIILKTVLTFILLVVLFFISYFVIKLILKSRNKYFSIIRILGGSKRISRELLTFELFIVCNLAYFMFIIFLYLNKYYVFSNDLVDAISYLTLKDYIVLYMVLILMSYLISNRYARKIFKDTAISTLKEEV